jgi:GTP pyrophosphokinase
MVYVEQRFASLEEGIIDADAWLASLSTQRSPEELQVLHDAVDLAEKAHVGQTRASGEPYISHVLAVAAILAELHLDNETLVAAILHDVVEDTEITLEDVRQRFGDGVAGLVDGVTKMELINDIAKSSPHIDSRRKEKQHAESLRKLLLAMAQDIRVVLIKLADRLHNMRTLKYLPEEKQRRIARETMEIYAPLANRLGIWQLKWELEDLSFRYTEPLTYKYIAKSLDERRIARENYIKDVIKVLHEELEQAGIKADINGRPKHIFSIWKKMQRKGVGIGQIYDTRAVRILVDHIQDCYQVLGIVHTLWPHIPKEFDDYIATPKENLYQSIHTAVVGPEGKTLEVQVRTHDMHRHAELGVAAHWRYKEGGKADRGFEQKVAWLRKLLEWQDEESSADDFIDRFKSEVFQDRVYVLTPGGDILDLPQGSTPLDFAYHIHSEVGHRCRGAKVDGRMVPLIYELKSGEQVEILTTKNSIPSRDWLNPDLGYIRTSRARSHIRAWFRHQDHDRHVNDGRVILDRELARMSASSISYEQLQQHFGSGNSETMLANIGSGDISQRQISGAIQQLLDLPREHPQFPVTRRDRHHEPGDVHIHGVGNLLTAMAKCCKPAAGDPVIGYITKERGVTIHRKDCPNVLKFSPEKKARLIEVEWSTAKEEERYPVDISIRGIDREGLLRDVTGLLADEHINVLRVNTMTDKRDYTVAMQLTLEVNNTQHLSRVLSRLEQLPNILQAKRAT